VFVHRYRPRLLRVLNARYGTDVGPAATAHALAHARQRLDALVGISNVAGELYRFGQSSPQIETYGPGRLAHLPDSDPEREPGVHASLPAALSTLNRPERMAVILVHAHRWTPVDAANAAAIPVATLRRNVDRGLDRLIQQFESTDFASTDSRHSAHDRVIDQLERYGPTLDRVADEQPVEYAALEPKSEPFVAKHATKLVIAASALGLVGVVGTITTRNSPKRVIVVPATSDLATTTTATVVASTDPPATVPSTAVPSTTTPPATPPPTETPPTTAPPTTAPPTTAPPTVPANSADLAAALPHLQLVLSKSSWPTTSHRRTGRANGSTADVAVSSSRTNAERTITIALVNSAVAITPTDGVTVRGNPAEVIERDNIVIVRWIEAPGVTAIVVASGLPTSSVTTIANWNLTEVSDDAWALTTLDAVEVPAPTPWDVVFDGTF
jgi:hypothetical protein